ncbi:MAG: hypothetical protein IT532_00855 [Burkholderiales bacterium]|nr:hypothetical protein [Burkholderiales bacterium]
MRCPRVVPLVVQCLVLLLFSVSAHAAEPKPSKGPLALGDLAEYVSGMGPTVGEVTVGPDESGYVVLSVPGAGEVPVHASKLRLLQRGGKPAAAFKAGEVVDLRTQGTILRAKVVKVNGAWCQLEAPGTVGWAECRELKLAKDGAVPAAADAEPAAAAPARTAASGPSPLAGTYANADGGVQIEFKPKGVAFMSMQGLTMECTHKGTAMLVVLTCDDEDLQFKVDDDGALRGPPDSFVARMKKK